MNNNGVTLDSLRDSELLYNKNPHYVFSVILLLITFFLTVVLIWSCVSIKTTVVKSQGSIVSENKNFIMSSYTGKIVEASVKEGDYVETGDTLFFLDSPDLDLQESQINGMIDVCKRKIKQLERLEKYIKEGKNGFDENNVDDKPYYYQYEAYINQIEQKDTDVSTYKNYGYTDTQIENLIKVNEAAIAEIYYSTLKTISNDIQSQKTEIEGYKVQLNTIKERKTSYPVVATTSGFIHMDTEYKDGMVIQAGSAIGTIVSENDKYFVNVYVAANDMPLIHIGDSADVAIIGLSQSIYGTIKGKVSYISSEASVDNEKKTSAFLTKIDIDSYYLVSNHGNRINISNGMAVEARIKYEEVTYFDYILESLGLLTR